MNQKTLDNRHSDQRQLIKPTNGNRLIIGLSDAVYILLLLTVTYAEVIK